MRRAAALIPLAALLGAMLAAPGGAASPESEAPRELSPESAPAPAPAPPDGPDPDPEAGAPEAGAPEASAPGAAAGPVLAHPARGTPPAPPRDAPILSVLPTAAGRGNPGPAERGMIPEALRLAARQAGRYRVRTAEETARPFGRMAAVPAACFTGACARRAARAQGAGLLVLSELSRPPLDPAAGAVLTLALVEAPSGRVRRAVRARACPESPGAIPAVQQAAWHLLLPPGALSPDASGADSAAAADAAPASGSGACRFLAKVETDSGAWRDIPWLNPVDSVDNRLRWALAGSGVAAAALGLAWAQGQLLQEDGNDAAPAAPLLPGGGAVSWMRGFFAAPAPGARYAAMGGAGLAHMQGALSVPLNPAGMAESAREHVAVGRRDLPGGAPSFSLAYSGPLKDGLHQGLAVQHEGDGLANETTAQAALAGDWGVLRRGLAGLKTGAALKLYLAKVGEEGKGADRSTGHSAGLGLDLGMRLRLSERVTAAMSVRDAIGLLHHRNTFTGRTYGEILPPEWRVGAAYRASPSVLLVMDGQKGLVADQPDHVRLGGEKVLFGFLAARAGLHQVFGRESVRTLSAGFGLDTDGLGDAPPRTRLALHYAYEVGLDEDEPLGAGQQFSLDLTW